MKAFHSYGFLAGILVGSFLTSIIPQLLHFSTTGTIRKVYTSKVLCSPLVYNVSNVSSERVNPPVPKKENIYLPNRGHDPHKQQIEYVHAPNRGKDLVYNLSNISSERVNPPLPKKEYIYLPNRGKDLQEQQIVKMAQDIVRTSTFETQWLCLIILNEAYIRLLENWLCGLHRFKATEVLKFTLFLALDQASYDRVAEFNRFAWFGVSPSSGMNYGSKEYYGLMHKRTNLVLALLHSGVSVFIGETDQVWQVDPIHHVQTSFQGMDVIAMDDSGTRHWTQDIRVTGGFLFLNSTSNTVIIWQELVEVHKIQMGLSPPKPEYAFVTEKMSTEEWGNEQITFDELLRRAQKRNKIFLGWLPYQDFRSGKDLGSVSKEFRMVHANWLIGAESKIQRLKEAQLWFVGPTGNQRN